MLRRVMQCLVAGTVFVGCGGDSATGPSHAPASVVLTSPIDTVLAVGRSAQLTSSVRDQSGAPLPGVLLTWTSSNPSIASVSASGLVTAGGSGNILITASISSNPAVAGTLLLRAVPADLVTVQALVTDTYGAALLAGLTPAKRAAAQGIIASCASAATSGNVMAISACTAAVRSEAASATDPTDRALLSVLSLFADHIARSLNLN